MVEDVINDMVDNALGEVINGGIGPESARLDAVLIELLSTLT
jgi:hypothetical protein